MGHMVKYPDRRDGSTLFDFYGNPIPASGAGLVFTAKGDIPVGTGAATGVMQGVGSDGQVLTADSTQTDGVKWATPAAPGTGTVTSVSVVSANGLAGTVATATTTPAITMSTTITGLLKGNGTAISAAAAGTDYLTPTGNGSGLSGIAVSVSNTDGAITSSPTTGAVVLSRPAATTVTVTSNAGTVPVTATRAIFTNSSAATMAITLATSGATSEQPLIVVIYDFSAAAETIGWTNTENSTVSVPTTSNGSTTLPLTVGFMFNTQTTKWRCVAVA